MVTVYFSCALTLSSTTVLYYYCCMYTTEEARLKITLWTRIELTTSTQLIVSMVAPVAQRYHVTSDTLGREFNGIFLTEKLKNENKNAQRVEND